MGKVIDIIGKKFGKLTVLDIHSERGNRGQIRYECKCDCGNSHITSGESIRSWKSKSCGCNRKNPPNKENNIKINFSHHLKFSIWHSLNSQAYSER